MELFSFVFIVSVAIWVAYFFGKANQLKSSVQSAVEVEQRMRRRETAAKVVTARAQTTDSATRAAEAVRTAEHKAAELALRSQELSNKAAQAATDARLRQYQAHVAAANVLPKGDVGLPGAVDAVLAARAALIDNSIGATSVQVAVPAVALTEVPVSPPADVPSASNVDSDQGSSVVLSKDSSIEIQYYADFNLSHITLDYKGVVHQIGDVVGASLDVVEGYAVDIGRIAATALSYGNKLDNSKLPSFEEWSALRAA